MTKSLTGRLINLFHRCDSTIRLDSISLTDEVRALEVLAKMRPMKDVEQEEEINKLKAQLAEYTYTPQAYDEIWKRVKEVVNENDELKAQLEKSINIQETDSN